jgi:hypothetical protein
MATELDGFAVLEKIGGQPDRFIGIKVAVAKAAHDLVVKHLKAKSTTLLEVRTVRKILGPDQFGLILDSMNDASVKSIVMKLDRYHPDMKASDSRWKRNHLRVLSEGSAEPSVKQPAVKRRTSARSKSPKGVRSNPSGLGSEVMHIFRERVRK